VVDKEVFGTDGGDDVNIPTRGTLRLIIVPGSDREDVLVRFDL
jgi:hypothetical protein